MTFLTLLLLQAAGSPSGQETAPPVLEQRKLTPDELLQKLANPLAALASFGMTSDFDYHVGPEEAGHRHTSTLQVTLPLSLGENWNVVSKTITPFVYQEEIFPGADTQFGVGDLTQVVYLAAVQPGRRGWVAGAGPLLRIPSSSDELLSSEKWSLGPSLALVRQHDDVTLGLIGGHVWSVAGDEDRPDISVTTLEPFITWRTEGLWNLSLRTTASYNHKEDEWTVPLILSVEKLASFLTRPVTITFGLRYWAEGPDAAPHDFGFRFGVTLVLQK